MEIKMCERVVNWDGGGEIGCNDDIFGFDMYFPPPSSVASTEFF
jgi:hypothetical protein